ncbi:MAG: FAD:protein FMN transferase [Deltaproteobacteria bacterium]|nr:MAG: FAD:protein FMN transferase [Deltaproteobacteria bacterium]
MNAGRRGGGRCLPFAAMVLGLACGRAPSEGGDGQAAAEPPPRAKAADDGEHGGPPSPPPVRKDGTVYAEGVLMGTRVSFNVWLPPGRTATDAAAAMEAAFGEIERIEGVLSEWQPNTELSRLNAAARRGPLHEVPVSEDLWTVLVAARKVSEASGGAFDVTFHGVGRLWSFEPGARPPSRTAIDQALEVVGYEHVILHDDSKSISIDRTGVQIGLGAIAKGYAVDRASAVLADRGFRRHIVEAGGDTYVSGRKGVRPWVVGVQDPDAPGPIGVLEVEDRAVVTSGDYQRFFEYEGRRYAHILDPTTGQPVPEERAPRSVTVVGPSAMLADAYATAVAVLGIERGVALVEQTPGLDAVVIDRAGRVHVTGGLASTFRLVRPHDDPGHEGGAHAAQRGPRSADGHAGVERSPRGGT